MKNANKNKDQDEEEEEEEEEEEDQQRQQQEGEEDNVMKMVIEPHEEFSTAVRSLLSTVQSWN